MGVQLVQLADGSVSLRNDSDALDLLRVGGPNANGVTVATPAWRGVKTVKIPLVAASGNGGMLAWQNPEPVDILIVGIHLRFSVAASAGTISVGTAANGSASSANLIDTLSMTTAGLFNNVDDKGAGGKSRQIVNPAGGAASFITGTAATPTFASFAGVAYLSYVLA